MGNFFQWGDIVSMGSLAVAALALILSSLRGHKEDAAQEQRVTDRLDRIKEITSDTRDTLRDLSLKLDDHATRLARAEERIESATSRLTKIETELSYKGLDDGKH